MGSARAWGLALLVGTAAACDLEPDPLPHLPEALVIVDTNVPVPLVAARLRIDLYDETGAWFETSDVARPSPADWPASFSVYSDDESRAKRVWIRLRAYGEGRQLDYRGERFRDWDTLLTPSSDAGDGQPRLLERATGLDVTPTSEPAPLLTIDRLLLVELRPSIKGAVRVVLDGACVGTMTLLGARGLPDEGAETCIATERARERVVLTSLDADVSRPALGATKAGTYASDPCRPGEGTEARICVAGGGTILGTDGISDYTPGVPFNLAPSPARFFSLGAFLVDRDEVTVARYRAAIAGARPALLPVATEGPLEPLAPRNCTWSAEPRGREDYALSCVDWPTARSFCQAEGGDLPSELQWEHVATVAGHVAKSRYPWGDELPTCERTPVGRHPSIPEIVSCAADGIGPAPYAAAALDRSPLGAVAFGGDLAEWVLDDGAPYTAPCWRDALAQDARCMTSATKNHVVRGGSWATAPLRGTGRLFNPTGNAGGALGFRCVYPVPR